MRLTLAGIPAALITLVLFIMMQAMVSSPDRSPGHSTARSPVAFVSPFDRSRGASGGAPALESLPLPPDVPPPPPLPDLAPPPMAQPPSATPSPVEAAVPPPEFPLELGRLVLPPPSPARTPPARRPKVRPAVQPKVTAARRPRPEPTTTESSAERQIAKLGPPATSLSGAGRADPSGERVGEQAGDTPAEAVPVVRVDPKYPRKAARAGREGWVKLAFTITPSGGVANVRVVESRPRRVFDRAARRALEQWRFRPQRIDGQARAREAVQVIEFRLADRG